MKNESKSTYATDFAEMMAVWNKIEAAAKAQFPNADKEELYQICSAVFDQALGINKNKR
jgi:hypothetical protein